MEKITLMDYFSTGDTMSDSPFLIQALFNKLKLIHDNNRKADNIDEYNILVNPDNVTDNTMYSSPAYGDMDEVIKKDLINLYCLAYGLYIYEFNKDSSAGIIRNQEVLKENFDKFSMVLPTEDINEFREAIVNDNPSYLLRNNSRFMNSKGVVLTKSSGMVTGIVGREDEVSNIKGFGAALFMGLSLLITCGFMAFLAYLLAK